MEPEARNTLLELHDMVCEGGWGYWYMLNTTSHCRTSHIPSQGLEKVKRGNE